MEELKKPDKKDACAKLMAAGYNIPAEDALGMFGDAHNTNWAENYQFFLNQNNPTNFERIWRQSYYLYRQIGTIQNPPVRFDQVMDFSIIQKLGSEEKYKSQTRRVPDPVGAEDRRRDPRRVGRNPHQHGRHPLLPERLGSAQEDHPQGRRQGRRGALRSERRQRAGRHRQAGRPVRRRPRHHRRPHRQLACAARCPSSWSRSCR